MNIKQQVKNDILTKGYVNKFGYKESERTVRRYLAELRKEGIVNFSVGGGIYKTIGTSTKEELIAYHNKIKASWQSEYFNTLLPIAKLVHDEKLIALMGGFDELH